MTVPNVFFFAALPYVAMFLFLGGTIQRYRSRGFQVSSLSSQFLEGRALFWGTVPFHFGILVVFLGHLTAFLVPRAVLAWNGDPLRLIILQVTAFSFGLSILIGLVGLMIRRFTNPRVRMVTTRMDVVLEVLLLAQVLLGLWTALHYRWGSSWFAADLSPYLWSILRGEPNIAAVSAMPWPVKLHIIGAFVIFGVFPFTRLVHLLVAPLHYLARPYQRVMWNWDRKAVRNPATPWSRARPRNT
ncbi:MAG: respiratory nitrate reductase subunit gamma [Deltaproteobacteria bacterium]|nr:respiratory nitrate reductase subunit gamma [Deltaproteobacteria bacterium]